MKGILKNKNLISIISVSVLFLVSIIGYSLTVSNKVNGKFRNEGYILTSSTSSDQTEANEYQQEYFKANESYSPKWPDKISFKNRDGKNVTTSIDQFVHYANGDMEALKDGVILDADKLNTKPLTYYNLKAGSLIKKNGTRYEIQNGNEKLEMSNIIWKISDQKFMFVSSNTTLNRENQTPNSFDNFVEFEFVDGGIVKLSNDKQKAMTIAPNTSLKMQNNVSLDLTTKAIVNGEKQKLLSLQQMVIDSNDNVNIEQNNNFGGASSNGNSGNGSNNNGSGSGENNSGSGSDNGSNNNSNSGSDLKFPNFESNVNDPGTVPDGTPLDKQNIILPSFILNKFTTTAISVSADFVVEDKQSLLSADTKVSVYETNTNKLVHSQNFASGEFEYTYSNDSLKPNTTYTMILLATYTYKGQEYQREFVTRTFKTDNIGISYDKNIIETDNASWRVNLSKESLIVSADLVLYDGTGQELVKKPINKSDAKRDEGQIIKFDNLTANKAYKVAIRNVTYNSSLLVTEYDEGRSFLTLKSPLQPGSTNIVIDKRLSTFEVSINGFSDPDNGLKNVTYGIYDPTDLNKPIESITKSKVDTQIFRVDNIKIKRNVNYVFKANYLFDDNEKTVEYSSLLSDVITMDGNAFPVINFDPTTITFNSIAGKLTIDNSSTSLVLNNNLKLKIQNSSQETIPDISIETSSENQSVFEKDFSISSLRSNESYRIKVYGTINLQDDNGPINDYFIKEFVVQTLKPNPFKTTFVRNYSTDHALDINLKLSGKSQQITSEYEAKNMKTFKAELYEGTAKDPKKKMGDFTLIDSKTTRLKRATSPVNVDLKAQFYDADAGYNITEATFGLQSSRFSNKEYTLFITEISDGTPYKNQIGVLDDTNISSSNKYTFRPKISMPVLTNANNYFEISVIRNIDTSTVDTDLDPNTVVGIKLRPKFDNRDLILKEYTVKPQVWYNNAWHDMDESTHKKITSIPSSTIPQVEFRFEKGLVFPTESSIPSQLKSTLYRGLKYRFEFTSKLDLTLQGNQSQYVDFPELSTDTSVPSQKAFSGEIEYDKQLPKIYGPIEKWVNYDAADTDNQHIKSSIKIDDPDNTLIAPKLKLYQGSSSSNITLTSSNDKYILNINLNSNNGIKEIKMLTRTKYTVSTTLETSLFKYNLKSSSTSSVQSISYTAAIINNQTLEINFSAVDTNLLNKVAAFHIKFLDNSNNTNIRVLYNQILNNTKRFVLPLGALPELKGRTFKIQIEAIYDNEEIKALPTSPPTNDEPWVLAKLDSNSGNIQYYNRAQNGSFSWVSDVKGAYWNNMYMSGNTIKLAKPGIDQNISTYKDINVQNNSHLLTYKQGNDRLITKKLSTIRLNKEVLNMTFNDILPTIRDVNPVSTVSQLNLSFTLSNPVGTDALKDNKVYFDLYTTRDLSGTPATHAITYNPRDNSNQSLSALVTGLSADTTYYIKIYGYTNREPSVKKYLLDSNSNQIGKVYSFNTSSSVVFSAFKANIKLQGSQHKVEFKYNVNYTRGYNKIKYEILKNSKVIKEFVDGVPNNSSVTKIIDIDAAKNFIYGENYSIKISALNAQNDNCGSNTFDFTLRTLNTPVVVNEYRNGSTNNQVIIKPIVIDSEYVVQNQQYRIELTDDQNTSIPVNGVTTVPHNINDRSEKTLTGLMPNKNYTLKIKMQIDIKKNGTYTEYSQDFSIKYIKMDEISLGSVSPSFGSDNKLTLLFTGSNGLNRVRKVNYSIYLTNNPVSSIITGEENIVISDLGDGIKQFKLNQVFKTDGLYRIRMEFKDIDGNKLIEYNGVAKKGNRSIFSMFTSLFKFITLIDRHKFNI